ncbi:GerMN domain-containing protein [Serpentinicella sp. ANB-PHB4]|uniref:GerMN domain-containing protein n=1 Tax=Serpentinicella sp. ANB-PHB4 TaxID=3074076 RepID=UPI00285C3DB4|nr:GerMN domain-containing protein [Serpentinicella sp. ANB-PHB4]MDR5658626.1 GerMN domain-containing protein [Serpentinicella sp. ANB-PHB4]
MRNKVIILLGLLLLTVMVITEGEDPIGKLIGNNSEDVAVLNEEGFIDGEDEGLRSTVLYYQNENGLLVPVMRRIPREEGMGRAAINQLVDQPALRDYLSALGLSPVLPSGTEVLGMTINEGICRIDLNENVLKYETKLEEQTIVNAIVFTLTEFEDVDQVQIMVEGQERKKLKHGTKVKNPIKPNHINLKTELSEEKIPIVVYYKGTTNGEESFFVPVTKGVMSFRADVKTVLTTLVEGAPEGSGLFSEIPEGTTVNHVYVRDGIAYIDFSEEINRMPQNANLQQSVIHEIGLTLNAMEPAIQQVRILSNGTEIDLDSNVNMNIPVFSNMY